MSRYRPQSHRKALWTGCWVKQHHSAGSSWHSNIFKISRSQSVMQRRATNPPYLATSWILRSSLAFSKDSTASAIIYPRERAGTAMRMCWVVLHTDRGGFWRCPVVLAMSGEVCGVSKAEIMRSFSSFVYRAMFSKPSKGTTGVREVEGLSSRYLIHMFC
jgi:hypothetical protein